MSIVFNNVPVERMLLQEHVLVMSVRDGLVSMMAEVVKDGFRIMGETYTDLYVEGDAIYFQSEAATDVQQQMIVRMPSRQIAEMAYAMLEDERDKW